MVEETTALLLLAVSLLGLAASASAQPPGPPDTPTILRDVPRVGYDIHLCPFPGSLCACMEYLGDACDYDYLMGVTGAAFRRLWNRDDGGNVDLMYLAPEPHRRAFEALGHEYRTVPHNHDAMIQAIKESIAKQRPVLSFGIIGPPEAGIVTGYDRDGEVLYGWSYFQQNAEQGYYELEGWFEAMSEGPPFGLIVIGDNKGARPAEESILVSSLEWAIDLARKPRRPGLPDHVSGLAAYDSWADSLEVDADYPADNQKVMETRAMVHCDQVVMLHERHSAAKYLRQMAESVPDAAEDLKAAAALYDETGDIASKVWRWGHWMQPEALKGVADPATRREFAGHIRTAKEKEAEAVEHLEKALASLRESAEGQAAVSHLELQASKLVNYPAEFRPNIEGMPVPSALRALMEFLGEDFGYTTNPSGNTTWRTSEAFPLFMGVWGDAFEFVWYRRQDAPPDDDAPPHLGDEAERYATTLHAAGFDCELLLKHQTGRTAASPLDPMVLRRRVVASIADNGWPVMLVDMPAPGHVSLITGYDEGGEVLIGWSAEGGDDLGIRFEPQKRLEIRDEFAQASAAVLLTGKHPRPPEQAVYRKALQQGVRFLRMREAGNFHAGPATFEVWARLLDDPTLSADDDATAKRRRDIFDPMIWDLATRRWYGCLFLRRAAELFPEAAGDLRAAADCFVAEHDMMWEINRQAGGQWPGDELPKLADPDVRKSIAEILLRSRDRDLEAAAHIEAALAVMGADE